MSLSGFAKEIALIFAFYTPFAMFTIANENRFTLLENRTERKTTDLEKRLLDNERWLENYMKDVRVLKTNEEEHNKTLARVIVVEKGLRELERKVNEPPTLF